MTTIATVVMLVGVSVPVPHFAERMPVPRFVELVPAPAFVERAPTLAPPMPELPLLKLPAAAVASTGHWETRRSCGPNGCTLTQVWVPDVQPSAPSVPVEAAAPTEPQQPPPAAQQPMDGEWNPRRRFGRGWR